MRFLKINALNSRKFRFVVRLVLPVALVVGYVVIAHVRHTANPSEKITPTVSQMLRAMHRAAFVPDQAKAERPQANESILGRAKRAMLDVFVNGKYVLWADTFATFKRFGLGLILLVPAVILGLYLSRKKFLRYLLLNTVSFFDKLVPVTVLPVLFVVFGIDETMKVMLVVLGVFPTIVLSTMERARAVPPELVIKASTLGASDSEVLYSVILRYISPKVMHDIRLSLKTVMGLVIVGEFVAASLGLGYRIFIVRRYMGMDLILPYVLWIYFLMNLLDMAAESWINRRYPWVDKD